MSYNPHEYVCKLGDGFKTVSKDEFEDHMRGHRGAISETSSGIIWKCKDCDAIGTHNFMEKHHAAYAYTNGKMHMPEPATDEEIDRFNNSSEEQLRANESVTSWWDSMPLLDKVKKLQKLALSEDLAYDKYADLEETTQDRLYHIYSSGTEAKITEGAKRWWEHVAPQIRIARLIDFGVPNDEAGYYGDMDIFVDLPADIRRLMIEKIGEESFPCNKCGHEFKPNDYKTDKEDKPIKTRVIGKYVYSNRGKVSKHNEKKMDHICEKLAGTEWDMSDPNRPILPGEGLGITNTHPGCNCTWETRVVIEENPDYFDRILKPTLNGKPLENFNWKGTATDHVAKVDQIIADKAKKGTLQKLDKNGKLVREARENFVKKHVKILESQNKKVLELMIGSVEVVQDANEAKAGERKRVHIRGVLAYAGVSHNKRLYLPEELAKGDGKVLPLLFNHATHQGIEEELDRLPKDIYDRIMRNERIVLGEIIPRWDPEKLTLFYDAWIDHPFFQDEVSKGMMSVSLGMVYDDSHPPLCNDVNCYTVVRDGEFQESSLVYHPGFPIASIEEVSEAEEQENPMYSYMFGENRIAVTESLSPRLSNLKQYGWEDTSSDNHRFVQDPDKLVCKKCGVGWSDHSNQDVDLSEGEIGGPPPQSYFPSLKTIFFKHTALNGDNPLDDQEDRSVYRWQGSK